MVWRFFKKLGIKPPSVQFSSVQLLSRVQLFATLWIAACQASLSITISWSLLRHVHRVCDAIQASHPLSSPSPPAPNPSQHQSLLWPSNPTPRHIPGENQNWNRHMYPNFHCSTIYNRTWKQPRCPLTDEWIKKLWYVYTMDYYLAVKGNAFESQWGGKPRAYYTE